MIRPILKDVYRSNGDEMPVDSGQPVHLPMVAEIGELSQTGVDLFYFGVCNSIWWENEGGTNAPKSVVDIHLFENAQFINDNLICLSNVNINSIKQTVNQVIDFVIPAYSWKEFGDRINPYLSWEFFNYQVLK
ncbi:MAG: Imm8 family immunity protein [Asticcacaulis sp.]